MRIVSIDKNSWITLERNSDEGHSTFKFEASVELNYDSFNAKNIDMHFLNFQDFLADYNAFITDRNLIPSLNGTYDSYIKFEGRRNNSIFLCFNLGSAFAGYSETAYYFLKGEFEVSSEYLNNYYEEFKKLGRGV